MYKTNAIKTYEYLREKAEYSLQFNPLKKLHNNKINYNYHEFHLKRIVNDRVPNHLRRRREEIGIQFPSKKTVTNKLGYVIPLVYLNKLYLHPTYGFTFQLGKLKLYSNHGSHIRK
jgi:hypothetical protein